MSRLSFWNSLYVQKSTELAVRKWEAKSTVFWDQETALRGIFALRSWNAKWMVREKESGWATWAMANVKSAWKYCLDQCWRSCDRRVQIGTRHTLLAQFFFKFILPDQRLYIMRNTCMRARARVCVCIFIYLWLPNFKTIGTRRWQGCQPCAPAAFTPRKHSWYSFLLEAESTPGP